MHLHYFFPSKSFNPLGNQSFCYSFTKAKLTSLRFAPSGKQSCQKQPPWRHPPPLHICSKQASVRSQADEQTNVRMLRCKSMSACGAAPGWCGTAGRPLRGEAPPSRHPLAWRQAHTAAAEVNLPSAALLMAMLLSADPPTQPV